MVLTATHQGIYDRCVAVALSKRHAAEEAYDIRVADLL